MLKQKAISIIIPAYNSSSSIKRLLDSIINQTFKDFEVIIIDDGSTDSTLNICREYEKKDKRINVYHKENEGVAAAREMGINKACGEYSIHADTDDWIEPNMLEALYKAAKKNGSDIVIADYYINKNSNEKIIKQSPSKLSSEYILSDLFNNKLFGALWNKLIRTDLYKIYDAKFFKEINYCEDLLILVQLLQHENIKISYCPQAFYHYVFNPKSITRNYTYKTYINRLKFKKKLKDLLHCSSSEEILKNVSFSIFIEAFIHNVLSEDEIKEGLKIYKNNIQKIKTLRWKIGFLFLKFGLYNLSHKFIHY